jgi:lipopolysaccharide/colanic/teichoic acid biosynthesis glycosyltransferase
MPCRAKWSFFRHISKAIVYCQNAYHSISKTDLVHKMIDANSLDKDPGTTENAELYSLSSHKYYDRGLWLLYDSSVRARGWTRIEERTQSYCILQKNTGNRSNESKMLRRSFDIVVSLLLTIIFSPLSFIIAVSIKLDSKGPIFFRHLRIGKDGKSFMLWKFRSMKIGVAKYEISPVSPLDTRLTRIGRLIRRLSLDEIPQLVNVLRGEMSLVGPRPEMPFIVQHYKPEERERLSIKPGITGLWQISPARAFPIHDNLQYDLHYIQHRTFLLDCAILLRTVLVAIRGIGAV